MKRKEKDIVIPGLSEKDQKIVKTLKNRLSVGVKDGMICMRLNLKDLCGEQTDLFEDLDDNIPKNRIN